MTHRHSDSATTPSLTGSTGHGESSTGGARFALTRTDITVLAGGFAIAGGALGWFLPVLVTWVGRIPFLDLPQVVTWAAALESPAMAVVRPGAGVLLGLLVTALVAFTTTNLEIHDDRIVIDGHDGRREIRRTSCAGVWFEDGNLVVLGTGGGTLFRGSVEGNRTRIERAFRAHGYPFGTV
ncbi:YqeB family protein [Brevibacterium samyangense]